MIELLEHNKPTYADLCEKMEKHNKVALVQATGTGKSYIIGKYLEEHKGKTLILVPTNAIGDQWEKLMAETDCDVTIDTYQGMAAHIEDESGYDIVIADEMHHLGSDVWGNAFINLFMHISSQKVIGATATEIRYLDNSRDMVDELFGGVAVRGCDLRTAIETGILPTFTYVSVLYGNITDYEEYKNKIQKIKKSAIKERMLGKLEMCKQNQKSIEQAIKENLFDEPHKIIVFLNSVASMDKTEKVIKKAFSAKKTYKINSTMKKGTVRRNISEFEDDKDRTVILFAIDMLNEGVHIDGVDVVAFFRTTESPAIYFQQLGRGLNVSDTKPKRVIFDFVCNSSNIKSVCNGENRENTTFISEINRGLSKEKRIIIKDYTKEIEELFFEIDEAIKPKRILENEIKVIKENSELSASELAKMLDRPIATIYAIAHKYGIKIRKDREDWDGEVIETIKKNSDKKYAEIESITGVPAGTIGQILRRNGFEKRRESVKWTKEQIEIAQDITLSNTEVAKKTGKTRGAVEQKRKKVLGLSDKERIRKAACLLYDNGESVEFIEKRLNICHSLTRNILIENGRIKKQVRASGGVSKKIVQIKDNTVIREYKNAKEAARENGFKSPGKLNQGARLGTKAYGFYWKYV